ncbi:MAG TPA: DUF3570 domain-containing protein [Steroidobacteraceae bacterium]|nr:DUF3570 domain-containing protein [Steroidobacteraceae bacterium]
MQLTPVKKSALALFTLGALFSAPSHTGVLPEDRVDVLFNRYEGGGQVISGNSWLIRKKFGDSISLSFNHLTDLVSGASPDVKLAASPYSERRNQNSLSADFLYGKATYSAGYINSSEPDYKSNTAFFSISQDMFGDLTTISMSYKRTWNDIFRMLKEADGVKIHDPGFGEKRMDERSYGVGLTQILTRNLILSVNMEVITDQGFLNNPYRDVRYLDPTAASGFSLEPEVYPNTRTSNAIGTDLKYYLPYRASADFQYRYFQDTWGIRAHTAQLGYTQPWRAWTFDGSLRYYKQNQADFYSDLFPFRDSQNFLARHAPLASYSSYSLGVGASYQFAFAQLPWMQKATANVRYNRLMIKYDDYRAVYTVNEPVGEVGNEPLYQLNANIFEVFLSVWF